MVNGLLTLIEMVNLLLGRGRWSLRLQYEGHGYEEAGPTHSVEHLGLDVGHWLVEMTAPSSRKKTPA
jgi:hypothetical protein